MASSVQKMLLIATLLLASACLASGFAPGSCGSFLSVRAGGSARNTCSMVQLRRSVSAPSLRFASLTLMAKKKDEDEVPEEVVEEATEAPAEEETEEVVEVRPTHESRRIPRLLGTSASFCQHFSTSLELLWQRFRACPGLRVG